MSRQSRNPVEPVAFKDCFVAAKSLPSRGQIEKCVGRDDLLLMC
jgi:hypothetical protein